MGEAEGAGMKGEAMSNPDVVSEPVADALKAAGWPQAREGWYYDEAGLLWQLAPLAKPIARFAAAPTIGELLACCAEQKWRVVMEYCEVGIETGREWWAYIPVPEHGTPGGRRDCHGNDPTSAPDALGRAVAEAMKGVADER